MTDLLGADASFSKQSAQALHDAGVKAIGRYAPGGGADPGKCITAAELAILWSFNIAVWLVFELSVGRWRGGYQAGLADGRACRLACRAIGWPDTRPIFTAYDENVGPADHDTFVAYQRGFNDGQASVDARCTGAAYGDGYVLVTLFTLGLIAYTWLSDSTAFYGSRAFAASGSASIVQWYGRTLPGLSGIDVDDLLVADFGQSPAPTTPAPTPQPTPRRPNDVRYFFTIPDPPAGAKFAANTVWLGDGFQARPMSGDNNLAEPKRLGAIAVDEGYPAGFFDLTKPMQVPYAEASRMDLVGAH